ncbi:alpha/beta fold hydrolase [Arthrobacter yangruifuii]|uniref:Alpha/beta fold hydrolase n=1 Tax=Arthrobacter yangruifuii TaxID=2606616 RepID=A0A5N6MUK7_9MICC|nr:alpha/beta hydrolase [Arthrobacter yangruifuii]KAD4060001.1 alpha/beta fold hydrolase [Arthrobacter yangruifuii]
MTTDIRTRNNVQVLGQADGPVLLFAHGYGCDQGMWSRLLHRFTDVYKVVLFDHVGSGASDPAAYTPAKYATLDGYVTDVLEVCEDLDLRDVTFIGHSVSAMMAISAGATAAERLARIILVAPSPSYMDYPEDGYEGGFSRADLDELLESLDTNYLVWAATMAPVIMGNPAAPALGAELEGSFCRVNPTVARQFARVAFLSDVRALLPKVSVPTLILQASEDLLAPEHVGRYLQEHIPQSTLVQMKATGHLPHVSAPEETADSILSYLQPSK